MRWILFIIGFTSLHLSAQETVQQVYLIGNFANTTHFDILLSHLETNINKDVSNTILVLGDITDENGISDDPGKANKRRLKQFQSLDEIKGSDVYFVGGDRDWDDNGHKGMEKIRNLEDYLEKKLDMKKAFVPSDACPGPKAIEISEELAVIAINSQWFIHQHQKPASPDTDCNVLTHLDFLEELEDQLDDYDDRNIIVMAHHPVIPLGKYGGYGWESYHLLPVIGTFYNSFRKYIGTAKDLCNPHYRQFAIGINKLLSEHPSLIYASAHEHHNQIRWFEENYHINTSASENIMKGYKTDSTLHLSDHPGYYRLDYYDDGMVLASYAGLRDGRIYSKENILFNSFCEEAKGRINSAYVPCGSAHKTSVQSIISVGVDSILVAGPEYDGGAFKRYWMGDQYRSEWLTPVRAPFLNLDSIGGGIKPYAKGGGLQTFSLKFKGKDKKKYVFRQVNKHPEKALSEELKQTIYRDITKDLITSQHPYGGLVASRLMKTLGILHAPPVLYAMPNDPRLGKYRKEFAGTLGTLEEKPKGKSKKRDGFANAEKILKSNQMFRSMYKEARNRIDAEAYALARVFDMWVGDWDRHEDNWVWAQYDDKKGKKFVPIPKDRDHVFSQWSGVIPKLADKFVMNAENFGYTFGNIIHLNFKARHLDRQLANELSREDWHKAVDRLKNKMDDEAIEEAFEVWPDTIFQLSGQTILDKLKSRREELHVAVGKLYDLLSDQVDVTGSNDEEFFEINNRLDGSLDIRMWRLTGGNEKKELLFERTFYPSQTKEVRLYGLSGEDKFVISGNESFTIKVRIVGGDKKDDIINTTGSDLNKVWVYGELNDDNVEGKQVRQIQPVQEAVYNNKAFAYNSLLPLPEVRQSSGNGFGVGVNVTKIKQAFNKPDYGHQYGFYGVIYPGLGAYRLEAKYAHRYFIRNLNLKIKQHFSTFFDQFPFYYGQGSKTDLDREKLKRNFYRLDFITAKSSIGLEEIFLRKSSVTTSFTYEYNDVHGEDEPVTIFTEDGKTLIGEGKLHIIGLESNIDLDFRDNSIFPKYGSYLEGEIQAKTFREGNRKQYIKALLTLSQYQTFDVGTDITFSVRGGILTAIGDVPFYELSPLGNNSYLRGYARNRFLDEHAVFYNLESRMHVATVYTAIAPIRIGIFGFFDSGKVWGEESFSANTWNDGYGGGLYIAPVKDLYNFNFYIAQSQDKGLFFDYRFGWRF